MLSTVRYVLLTATRDRLFFALFAGVLFATFVCSTIGATAMVEPLAMTLTLSAAAARLILMVGLIVFVCFHLRAAFQTREIDVLLSRPISRASIVMAYWLGFATVATILVVPTVGLLCWIGMVHEEGLVLWSVSLWLESLLVIAVALFAGFTLRSAVTAVMASLGFYVLSRMVGFFIATAQSGNAFKDADVTHAFRLAIDVVSVAVPRLDFFGKTEWLVYGMAEPLEWQLFVEQAVIFIPLLVIATIVDFKRRQF